MPLDVSRIRALCFDVDGTLSDTDDHYIARITPLIRRIPGVTQPEHLARRLIMMLESPANFLMGLADRLTLDDELIGLINFLHRWSPSAGLPLPCVPGVAEMLGELSARYPLAVVSARQERTTLAFLEQAGFLRYFQVVVTALSTSRTKPFPDPVLLAARQLGVEPQFCVMIGDTTVDIRAGRLAGAQTIGVLCGFGEEAELKRHGADLILPSTADILNALRAESG